MSPSLLVSTRALHRAAWTAAVAGLLAVFAWLFDIAGPGLPQPLAAATAVAALLGVAYATGAHLLALWRRGGPERDVTGGRLLVVLLVLSFVVRYAGLDHEIVERSYLDEGTYHKYATAIDAGDVFPTSFVYPHFLFYLQAFALWLLHALDPLASAALGLLSRASTPLEVEWLTLRLVVATLCALVTVPVFLLARQLGGRLEPASDRPGEAPRLADLAAATASLLVVFSALLDAGAHLDICDAPSGVWAMATVWLCGLVLARQQSAAAAGLVRLYVSAGVCAGLAAATKYPAGIVAVAIIAVAAHGVVTARAWRWHLLWAGLAAIAAFVVTMPALLVHAERVFGGGRDILFGFRQYAGGGWIGVQPTSNTAYYGGNLLASYGLPAFALAALGAWFAPRRLRADLLWLAAYPAAFLLLVGSMSMVVRRNLFPVVPALAALLGPLVVSAVAPWLLRQPSPARRRALVASVAFVVLAVPLWRTGQQTIGFVRANTRELAAAWMRAHLPPGAGLVKESYTPDFSPAELLVRPSRFAARLTPEELRGGGYDYLLLASSAYQRFLDDDKTTKEHQQLYGERYRAIRQELPRLAIWEPGATRLGPVLELYRLEPLAPPILRRGRTWNADDAFVPDPTMREAGSIRFADGGWAMFKGWLAPGRWTCAAKTAAGAATGTLTVVDDANRELAHAEIASTAAFQLRPPDTTQGSAAQGSAASRSFLYLRLAPGQVLTSLECARAGTRPAS